MKITIGSDHRGFRLKAYIIEYLTQENKNIELIDVGTDSEERTDYPIFAEKVCKNVLEKKSDHGILICGSGIGASIAANRFKKIYAALCWNEKVASLAKMDDFANVLILPADFVDNLQAVNIINVWLKNSFKGGRYQERLDMVDKLVKS